MLRSCGISEQVVDICMKSLPQAEHEFFVLQLGICNFKSRGVLMD